VGEVRLSKIKKIKKNFKKVEAELGQDFLGEEGKDVLFLRKHARSFSNVING
jgi:hypothetical protein